MQKTVKIINNLAVQVQIFCLRFVARSNQGVIRRAINRIRHCSVGPRAMLVLVPDYYNQSAIRNTFYSIFYRLFIVHCTLLSARRLLLVTGSRFTSTFSSTPRRYLQSIYSQSSESNRSQILSSYANYVMQR